MALLTCEMNSSKSSVNLVGGSWSQTDIEFLQFSRLLKWLGCSSGTAFRISTDASEYLSTYSST